ncbi:MAG: hypothetical protein E7667_03410 [Ruminococcaceae bacterium]|nr:hypothetical protein [Oscillospiraceae bacterium]
MNKKEEILVPYNLILTLCAAGCAFAALVLFIISAAVQTVLIAVIACTLLLGGAVLAVSNKKIVADKDSVRVIYFLGILKSQSYSPRECGFFISEPSASARAIYIDKRTVHRDISSETRKYIYISEYVLSKQEQDGSEYSYNEPILILNYSKEIYDKLSRLFEFNSTPFK